MDRPKRKRNRLERYDYDQPGYYFITICTDHMAQILCRGAQCAPATNGFPLSEVGSVVERSIQGIPHHYPTAKIDKYVVMPNHIHMILVLSEASGRTMCAPTCGPSVPHIIKQMKEFVTKQLGCSIWQKSYHDHIIRSETDYLRIWRYIDTNPAKWREDRYFTEKEGHPIMKYVTLGKTGLRCAAVSFGGIPIQRSDAANTMAVVDALERHGLNFIDTARGYTVSEEYLGAALKGRRDKFILATKSMSRDYESMKRDIETSLQNLQADHIDLYQFHNLPLKDFDQVFGPDGAYRALTEAKAAGKIGHIGATAHSVDALRKMIQDHSGQLETLMFPYNIVETHGHDLLAQARAQGIGTIAMKPMAGGNLDDWKLALRYIDASGVIDISIPGMGSVEEVERNAAAADQLAPLTAEDLAACEAIRRDLGTHFCRRCGYCAPCTVGIDIPSNFLMVNYLRKYGLGDWAKGRYAGMAHHAGECIDCGQCESRCPYELPIREMLKGVAREFGA